MIKCDIDFIGLMRQFLANTGRGTQHHGHYQACLQNPKMKYSLVELGMGGIDIQGNIGLCLPRSCPDKTISNFIDSAFKILGTDLRVFWIKSDTEHYEYPLFWVSYLTIFLITSLLVLAFIATTRGYKSKQNKYLNSFNITANLKHFNIRQNQPLNIWDGVRSLAMMWVVIGHVFSFWFPVIENIGSFTIFANKPFMLVLEAGLLSVDVFFCLGGFFLAFIMLRNRITIKICLLGVLQRALRIWPAYILCMLFYYTLYMKTGSGPLWSNQELSSQYCKQMWRQVLFISTYFDGGAFQCMGWGWYLQVDFQLFILGVLLLYLYSIKKTIMYATLLTLSILSSIYVFVIAQISNFKIYADIEELLANQDPRWFSDVYITPYGRCVPYLMGLALGAMYMEYRKQCKQVEEQSWRRTYLARVRIIFEERRFLRIGVQWLGIGLMALVSFIPRPLQTGSHWPQVAHSFYWILSKPIFILGMMLTVLPTILSIPNSFFALLLNVKIFAWIARISFCTYLVHLMIVFRFIYNRTYDFYYTLKDIFVINFGLLVICLFFGFLLTMLVELPFANLLKITMTGFKTRGRGGNITSKKEKSESMLTTQSTAQDTTKQIISS